MPSLKKIFILDDEEEILELLERILGNQYIVFTKSNAESLEEDLLKFRPDVIMIDHFMGETTSKDVLTKALDLMEDVPVILHSAHEDIEKLCTETNVAGFIRKPSGIKEIREKVADVLNMQHPH